MPRKPDKRQYPELYADVVKALQAPYRAYGSDDGLRGELTPKELNRALVSLKVAKSDLAKLVRAMEQARDQQIEMQPEQQKETEARQDGIEIRPSKRTSDFNIVQ